MQLKPSKLSEHHFPGSPDLRDRDSVLELHRSDGVRRELFHQRHAAVHPQVWLLKLCLFLGVDVRLNTTGRLVEWKPRPVVEVGGTKLVALAVVI